MPPDTEVPDWLQERIDRQAEHRRETFRLRYVTGWPDRKTRDDTGRDRRRERSMNTNEQAQKIIELIHNVSGQLLEASRDGKIDMGELVQVGLKNLPTILSMAGVNAGN